MKTIKLFRYISVALIIFALSLSFNFPAFAGGKKPVLVVCVSSIGEVIYYGNDCPTGSGNCIVNNCSTKPSINAE